MDTLTAWPRRRSRYLILLFAVALTVRIAFNLFVVGVAPDPNIIDTDGYGKAAWNLATAGQYAFELGRPTSFKSPLFPMAVAGLFRVFGFNLLAVRLMLSIAGALTCIVVYFLGCEVKGQSAGRVAGLMAAGYPFLFFYNAYIMSETFFLLLLSLATLLLLQIQRASARWRVFSTGVVLGMASLTRPVLFPFFPLVFLWAGLLWKRQWRQGLGIASAIVITSMVVLSPWIVRNYLLWGRLMPGTTTAGVTLLGSHNPVIFNDPERVGDYLPAPAYLPESVLERIAEMSESELDLWATRKAIAFVGQHREEMIRVSLYKLGRFWILPPVVEYSGRLRILWALFYLPVLGLAIYGMIATRHLGKVLLIIYLQFIYFTAVAAVFYGSFRMRAPLEPYLVVFAAIGLLGFVEDRFPTVMVAESDEGAAGSFVAEASPDQALYEQDCISHTAVH